MSQAAQTVRGVPSGVRYVFDDVVARTDAFCQRHLDHEYAELCQALAAKLARKRPSPLMRGDLGIWAAAIVYVIGRVNFLHDPASSPHLPVAELATLLDVKQTTMANKGRLIMDMLKISDMDPEFSRRDTLDGNPLAWFVNIDGLIMDARSLPVQYQAELHRRGLIPYVPAQP